MGRSKTPMNLKLSLHSFLGLVRHFRAFCLPYKPGFCLGGGCVVVVAPPRCGRPPASAFSGLREQNIKTPPILHLIRVDEQHIMIDDLL